MATINVDFDGTLTSHEFPEVGKEIGAAPVLKTLAANGHQLILFTMRCDFNGTEKLNGSPTDCNVPREYLQDAVDWFDKHGIPLYGIQANPTQKSWTTSPKSYAEYMIDDSAVGTPMMFVSGFSERIFVDWLKMTRLLRDNNLITDVDESRIAIELFKKYPHLYSRAFNLLQTM